MLSFFKKKNTIKIPALENLHDQYDLVVHIGAPKTGSSAIQKYLLENRNKLIDLGYYYPEHGLDENGISGGHSIIGKNLLDGELEKAQSVLNTFIEEAKQQNYTLLLSTEAFFYKPNELKKIMEGYRCKIICFFRDPIDSIYSAYNQTIKRHYATTRLERFCLNLLAQPAEQFSGELIEEWASIFEKKNVTVIGYDLDVFKHTPIQSVFFSSIGISEAQQKKFFKFDRKFINNSYCLAALELKRMLNYVLDREQVKYNEQIDYFLQNLSDNSEQNRYQLADRIKPETLNALLEKFSLSNQKIRNELLLKVNPDFFTSSKNSVQNQVSQAALRDQIQKILFKLQNEKPTLYQYLDQQLHNTLAYQNNVFEVLKLAELFNIDINQIEGNEAWFTQHQLDKMPNFKLADFYRDIANLCYQRGDLKNAAILIEQALIHRPKGPGIIKLSEKIKSSNK